MKKDFSPAVGKLLKPGKFYASRLKKNGFPIKSGHDKRGDALTGVDKERGLNWYTYLDTGGVHRLAAEPLKKHWKFLQAWINVNK